VRIVAKYVADEDHYCPLTSPLAGRSAGSSNGPELANRPYATIGKSPARANRHLFRGRFHYPAVGSHGLSGIAGQLEGELLRMECSRLRLGCRYDAKHSMAPAKRGTGWRATEGYRSVGGNK